MNGLDKTRHYTTNTLHMKYQFFDFFLHILCPSKVHAYDFAMENIWKNTNINKLLQQITSL